MRQTIQILQTGTCISEQTNYIPSTTSNVLWGRLPYRKPPRWSAGNHSDHVGAALPYGVISTRHARGVLAGSEDFDVHGLIDLAKELYKGME